MISWLMGRAKMTREEAKTKADEIAKEVAADPGSIQKGVSTFKRNSEGIYVEERQWKALVREASSTSGLLSKYGMRDLIAHGMFTEPDKIHLLKPDGAGFKEADLKGPDTGNRSVHVLNAFKDDELEFEERTLHVQTPQGPRDALKRAFYVEKPVARFIFKVTKPVFKPKTKAEREAEEKAASKGLTRKPKDPQAIDADTLQALFTLGQDIGLGADRSQGQGKYNLIKFAPLAKP